MPKISVLAIALFATLFVQAQDIIGQWNGVLKLQGLQLRLVFNISKSDDGFGATMDSPDQGAKGIPVATTRFENGTLHLAIPAARIEYEGVLNADKIIVGNFKQAGQSFPLNLSKEKIANENKTRSQEPAKPYPYYSEDLNFENKKAGFNLAGTLTLPTKDGTFPVVILITGSGPQNRDEEVLGHKPFLVLSDYLTKKGFAVLRFDDRGVASSKGNFATATTMDFATDVEAAIDYLKTRKEIDKNKIGLIGHSEGGIIAPIVASKSKDVAFIVLLAGTGVPGDKVLLMQQQLIGAASGVSKTDLESAQTIQRKAFDIVKKSVNTQQLKNDLTRLLQKSLKDIPATEKPDGMSDADFVDLYVSQMTTPWMVQFIKYNPAPTLQKVRCPVLAVNGAKDLQIPPKENLHAIQTALKKGGNKIFTMIEFPNLNHLFQESKTGLPAEYATIEQTFSPTAMAAIFSWLQQQVK